MARNVVVIDQAISLDTYASGKTPAAGANKERRASPETCWAVKLLVVAVLWRRAAIEPAPTTARDTERERRAFFICGWWWAVFRCDSVIPSLCSRLGCCVVVWLCLGLLSCALLHISRGLGPNQTTSGIDSQRLSVASY